MTDLLPEGPDSAVLLARVWRPDVQGPAVCLIRDNAVVDITGKTAPTVRDVMEMDDPISYLKQQSGQTLGNIDEIAANSLNANNQRTHFLAPIDLQAIKACGVTFAQSMIERVIEEKARGNPHKAAAIRERCTSIIGDSLSDLQAGSEQAAQVKAALQEEGVWSQYLEVGIGPDAEVFTKAQCLSAVGWGASVGLHPISTWNNPEPEVVLVVNSRGQVKGATLGNDVNLRDIEGRSALLLGKAKDNNASCAIGPFIRLFDNGFDMATVRQARLELKVTGTEDDFVLTGHSSMQEISREPLDIIRQVHGRHHQYPDGFVLFMGTLFAPTQDRDQPGEGFTHKCGDVVTISNPALGTLRNTVKLSTECPEWTFGMAALMRNLAARELI